MAALPSRAKSRREQMQQSPLLDHLAGEREQRSGNSKIGQ